MAVPLKIGGQGGGAQGLSVAQLSNETLETEMLFGHASALHDAARLGLAISDRYHRFKRGKVPSGSKAGVRGWNSLR